MSVEFSFFSSKLFDHELTRLTNLLDSNSNSTQILSLNLSSNKVSSIQSLLDVLRARTWCVAIDLKFCAMEYCREVSTSLFECCGNSLRSLDLSWTAFPPPPPPSDDTLLMLSITKYGTSLEKLVLHATKLSNRALLTFANSLRQGMCSRLQQLDLSSNDALDVANVASLITDAARLTSLNLSAIRNVGTDIGVIANALLRQTSLRALQLTKCEISNQGLKSLAEALVFNRRIESISIGHAPLTDDGATTICEVLKQCDRLSFLALQGDFSAASQLDILSRCLVDNTSLLELQLKLVTAREGVDAFSKLIAQNRHLRAITFRPASVWPDTDVCRLFDALRRNTTLHSLSNNGLFTWLVSADATKSIADCIASNTTLTLLHFMCDFGSSHDLVEQALSKNYWLLSIRIAYRRPSTVLQLSVGNRNLSFSWRVARETIIGICLVLAPLLLHSYVILEIIDWLPGVAVAIRHGRKIKLIMGVMTSYRNLLDNRSSK